MGKKTKNKIENEAKKVLAFFGFPEEEERKNGKKKLAQKTTPLRNVDSVQEQQVVGPTTSLADTLYSPASESVSLCRCSRP